MQARTGQAVVAGRLQRLRNVDTDGHDRQTPAQPETDRICQRIAEAVEGVAEVEERGGAEAVRQVALDLDRAGDQVAAADALHRAVGRGRRR